MKITSKGQITIPQDLRKKFGLLPYTEVKFEPGKGGVLIVPSVNKQEQTRKNILAARGIAEMKTTTEQIMKLTRD